MTQRLQVLGAGTALPDIDRDNTFLVWDSPAGGVLIDCGGRAYQQLLRAAIDPLSLRAMILTHNHPDHIYGVPAFLFHLWLAGYERTIDIYANAPTLAMARRLCEALELEQAGHMAAVRWHELPETPNYSVLATDAYTISSMPVRHSRPTLALKIEDHERRETIVYSADTEPCPELEQLARGAHTLIHEATIVDPQARYGHTTAQEAGGIAQRCGVQRLILIHFSAQHTQPEVEAINAVRAAGFSGDVEIARELVTVV